MNVDAPIILDLVLLNELNTRTQLKAEGEVCFFLVLMGPDPPPPPPPLFLLLDLFVKWYDNDDSKGVQFLQGKFHSFHPFATILIYLTKAPPSPRCQIGLFWFSFPFFFLFFCVCVVRGCDMCGFCVNIMQMNTFSLFFFVSLII